MTQPQRPHSQSGTTGAPGSPFAKPGQYYSGLIAGGTVRSRIAQLQQLEATSPVDVPQLNALRPREESWTSHGKRRSPRFAKPASRNSHANEHHQTVDSHSYLGLNTPRANHLQEHAAAEFAPRWNRTTGLHGQVRPHGEEGKSGIEAARQGERLPTIKSYGDLHKLGNSGEGRKVALKASKSMMRMTGYNSPTHCQNPADFHHLVAQPPPSPETKTEQWRHKTSLLQQQQPKSISHIEDPSADSTVSTRKQSVRDLFEEYGITRPRGLLSSDTLLETETNEVGQNTATCCHSCKWDNDSLAVSCLRCGHLICSKCESISYTTAGDDEQQFVFPRWSTRRLSSRPLEKETILLEDDPFMTPMPLRTPSSKQFHGPDRSSTETRHRSLKAPKVAGLNKMTSVKRRPLDENPSNHKSTPNLQNHIQKSPARGKTYVSRKAKSFVRYRDNPFLIADALSPSNASRLQPGVPRVQHKLMHEHEYFPPQEIVSIIDDDHQASHLIEDVRGHQYPLQSCSGYPAEHIDLVTQVHHSPASHGTQHNFEESHAHVQQAHGIDPSHIPEHSYLSGHVEHNALTHRSGAHEHDHSSPHVVNSPFLAREYVECYGYPRTGHDSMCMPGSPSEFSWLGACQHCLSDCQCEACRNAHHSVRCCVHPSHEGKTRVHRHPITVQTIVTVPVEKKFLPGADQPPATKQDTVHLRYHSPQVETASVQKRTDNPYDTRREQPQDSSLRDRRKSARRKTVIVNNPSPLPKNEQQMARPSPPQSPILTTKHKSQTVEMPVPRRMASSPPWMNTNIVTPSKGRQEQLVKPSTIRRKKTMEAMKEQNHDSFVHHSKPEYGQTGALINEKPRNEVEWNNPPVTLRVKDNFAPINYHTRNASVKALPTVQGPQTITSSPCSASSSRKPSLTERLSSRRLSRLFKIGSQSSKAKVKDKASSSEQSKAKASTSLLHKRLEEEQERQREEEKKIEVVDKQKEKGRKWGDILMGQPDEHISKGRSVRLHELGDDELADNEMIDDGAECGEDKNGGTVSVRRGNEVKKYEGIESGTRTGGLTAGGNSELGITGISIVIHMEGKDDLILNTSLNGGSV